MAVELPTTLVHEIAELDSQGELAPRGAEWHHDPEPNGAIFRIVTLRPIDPDADKPLHASPTVDIGVVLSGSVELRMADGAATTLTAGVSFVLRGGDHAWVNHGPDDCELAVVLLKPATRTQEARA